MNFRNVIRGWHALAMGLALAGLAACGGGDGGVAPAQAGPAAVVIGSAGGTVFGPDGVSVVVPPDALAADTSLQITAADGATVLPLPAGVTTSAPPYNLLPHGTQFSVPALLTIPRAAGDPASGMSILKTNLDGSAWEQLETTTDATTHSALITSFSIGRMMCNACPVNTGPPVISMHPASGSVNEGGFVLLAVSAIGDPPLRFQWLRDGIVIAGETTRSIVVNPVTRADDGMRLSVIVTDRDNQSTTSNAGVVTVRAGAPVVASQPADVVAVAGSTATFVARTSSSVAKTLSWERKNPAPGSSWGAAGSQSDQLDLPNVQIATDDQALFRLVATNSGGSVMSREVRLTVIPAQTVPVFLDQPDDVSTVAGRSASFSVFASGGGLGYLWERSDDGGSVYLPVGVSGTSAVLTLSNTAIADDGALFRVVVKNLQGTVPSNAARLAVASTLGVAPRRLGGGRDFSIGLRADGGLMAWGSNLNGQLGLGSALATSGPSAVLGLSGVATFSVGEAHTLAILGDGTVHAWGTGTHGELGDGLRSVRTAPAAVGGGASPARYVAAGSRRSMAGNDAPWYSIWGASGYGNVGDRENLAPVQIVDLALVSAALGTGNHALGLRADGTVWSWGRNRHGQLGTGDIRARLTPEPIPTLTRVIAVVAGEDHSLALTEDGSVHAWGRNLEGQLGIGSVVSSPVPVAVPLPGFVVAIAAGNQHSLALLSDGRVYAWGGNSDGAIGNGVNLDALAPVRIDAAWSGPIQSIGAGWGHSLALDAAGGVWAWGANGASQLGDGTAAARNRPVQVPGLRLD